MEKEKQIEKLPKDWNIKQFEDFLDYIQPTPFIVESTEYSDDYKIPVLTAGKSFIKGYTNEIDGIFNSLPVIIFDDFTTANKFVNFPFKVKSSAMKILKAKDENVNIKFVYYYMQTVRVSFDTHKRYWISVFSKLQIPSPPKLTQLAIVSKIEELFSEIENGIKSLFTAKEQLKKYRQSVLKWAFEGKLSELRFTGFKDDKIKTLEKDGSDEILKSSNPKNHSSDKEGLPEGWKWVKFGEVFSESPQNGLYKPSTQYGSGIPIIRIDGFYNGVILDDYQYKRVQLNEDEIKRYLISAGDILVNRVNSMPYLGKCGIVKHLKEKTVFESNIMKIRVKKETALPEYFTMYLSSRKGITELRKNAKQAVNQASINQTDVSNVMIPLCSIEEQKAIVQAIESRFSVADKMEESITESLQQAEALKQSILKKAFEGRLI
jgi:type I restriction enzyme S subunit